MPVSGVVVEPSVKGRTKNRHQVFVAGSNADYSVTVTVVDDDGVEHVRTPANNTINGASGVPIIISGRYVAMTITPPDGLDYTYSIKQLDS